MTPLQILKELKILVLFLLVPKNGKISKISKRPKRPKQFKMAHGSKVPLEVRNPVIPYSLNPLYSGDEDHEDHENEGYVVIHRVTQDEGFSNFCLWQFWLLRPIWPFL